MEENKHIYIAIDSDILRALTNLDLCLEKNPYYDFEKSDDHFLKRNADYLQTLMKIVRADEIRLLIVNTVYQESKHSPSLCNFIKKYCYFPDINIVNYNDKSAKTEKLANLYCKPYTYKDKECPAPMKATYNAFAKSYVPTNDAYIMAEASIEGAMVLTANKKDFIENVRTRSKHDRSAGIVQINIQNGYCEKAVGSDFIIVPKPITIGTIGPIISNDFEHFTANYVDDNTKIKADRIL